LLCRQTVYAHDGRYQAGSGFLSSQSTHTIDTEHYTDAVGSTLSGDTVTIRAGRDVTVAGTGDVSVGARHGETITAAQTLSEASDAQSAYESGAVRANSYTWYAQGNGGYYRYFSDNAGTVHFSGTIPESQVPNSVVKILGK
jgi:hypothetical protein